MNSTIYDFHLHLNGSVSNAFLERVAERNQVKPAYERFRLASNPWEKFGYIHQIIQTPQDIFDAVLDVAEHSDADVIRIRTTLKPLQNKTEMAYLSAFKRGLAAVRQLFPNKDVRGLLSVDRSRHNLADASKVIELLAKEQAPYLELSESERRKKGSLLVGLDLSGKFHVDRTLFGDDLAKMVTEALSKNISLALHMGEIDSAVERDDIDHILSALEAFQQKHDVSFEGRVRFGHVIHTTEIQKARIIKLGIPLEVCPTCHEKLGWWQPDKPHPILFQFDRNKIVPGTDDSAIFDCTASSETNRLLTEVLSGTKPSDNTRSKVKARENAWRNSLFY